MIVATPTTLRNESTLAQSQGGGGSLHLLVMGPKQFATFANDWSVTNGTGVLFSDPTSLPNTDWQSLIFHDAPISSVQVGVTGGSSGANATRYALSGGTMQQQGVVVNSSFKRVSLRGSVDQSIGDRFDVGSGVTLSRVNSNSVPTDGSLNAGAGAFSALQQQAIEIVAGIDYQWVVQLQTGFSRHWRRQNCLGDEPFGSGVFNQKRILTVRFVSQSAAAGFLPGELLVEKADFQARRCQALSGERACRPSAQNRNPLHFLPVGGRSSGEGMAPWGFPGTAPPPPCGFAILGGTVPEWPES